MPKSGFLPACLAVSEARSGLLGVAGLRRLAGASAFVGVDAVLHAQQVAGDRAGGEQGEHVVGGRAAGQQRQAGGDDRHQAADAEFVALDDARAGVAAGHGAQRAQHHRQDRERRLRRHLVEGGLDLVVGQAGGGHVQHVQRADQDAGDDRAADVDRQAGEDGAQGRAGGVGIVGGGAARRLGLVGRGGRHGRGNGGSGSSGTGGLRTSRDALPVPILA